VSIRLLAGIAAALALAAPAATAKDFDPGDLRICNAHSCVAITDGRVVPLLGAFYYSGCQPPTMPPVAVGARQFELRFRNGYATGIVATARLNRVLSYGVNLDRFTGGRWYAVPDRLAAEFRRLTARMRPLHVAAGSLALSR
jgi:hypothetical protein